MKLFGRAEVTIVEAATTVRDKAAAKRDRLLVQLDDAARELGERKDATAQAALNENAADVADCASDVAAATATYEAIEHAVGVANAEVAAAERGLAAAQDAEQRAASVAELTALIDQIEAAVLPFGDALADLLSALRRGAEVSHDAKSVCGFVELLQSDMPQMINSATTALGLLARNIEHGSAPARLPKPAPLATPVATSAPANTVSVCLLFDGRWRDPSTGLDRHAAKGWDAGLAPDVAARVIAAGVAVRSDSAQAKKLRVERASPVPNPDAIDLDNPAVAPPGPPAEKMINPHLTQWQMPAGAPRPWLAKGSP